MNAGGKEGSTESGGQWQPGRKNFFCRFCGRWTSVERGLPDPVRCDSPGCIRPFGFGTAISQQWAIEHARRVENSLRAKP